MPDLSYETYRKVDTEGIYLSYSTAPGGYHPLHWHEEIELLYQLNGRSDIQIDGKKYQIQNKLLTVINSRQVHSVHTYSDTSMFICVHISKKLIEKYIPDIDLYRIYCIPDDIPDSQFPEYLSVLQADGGPAPALYYRQTGVADGIRGDHPAGSCTADPAFLPQIRS